MAVSRCLAQRACNAACAFPEGPRPPGKKVKRLSLLSGSLADGVFQHDIIRHYAISRCADMRERQRRFVEALLAARPASGWPTVDDVERGTAKWYVATYAWWHIRGAALRVGAPEDDTRVARTADPRAARKSAISKENLVKSNFT